MVRISGVFINMFCRCLAVHFNCSALSTAIDPGAGQFMPRPREVCFRLTGILGIHRLIWCRGIHSSNAAEPRIGDRQKL